MIYAELENTIQYSDTQVALIDSQDKGLNTDIKSIPEYPLPQADPVAKEGSQSLLNLRRLLVGAGSKSMRMSLDGFWAGAEAYLDSKFSVSPEGKLNQLFYFPLTDGSNQDILQTDGSGVLSFVTPYWLPLTGGTIDGSVTVTGSVITDSIIMQSPDGTYWEVTVDNSGNLVVTNLSSGTSGSPMGLLLSLTYS